MKKKQDSSKFKKNEDKKNGKNNTGRKKGRGKIRKKRKRCTQNQFILYRNKSTSKQQKQ